MAVTLKGQKALQRHIKRMSNPQKLLDPAVKKAARVGVRELGENTPRQTGNTARAWSNIKKISKAKYLVKNESITQDKKQSLILILDQGRGEILPVKAKRLYIPLSNKGRSKKLGQKIPSNLVYGQDYVLAKKAKAFKGKKFIDPANKKAQRVMTKEIINIIRKEARRRG